MEIQQPSAVAADSTTNNNEATTTTTTTIITQQQQQQPARVVTNQPCTTYNRSSSSGTSKSNKSAVSLLLRKRLEKDNNVSSTLSVASGGDNIVIGVADLQEALRRPPPSRINSTSSSNKQHHKKKSVSRTASCSSSSSKKKKSTIVKSPTLKKKTKSVRSLTIPSGQVESPRRTKSTSSLQAALLSFSYLVSSKAAKDDTDDDKNDSLLLRGIKRTKSLNKAERGIAPITTTATRGTLTRRSSKNNVSRGITRTKSLNSPRKISDNNNNDDATTITATTSFSRKGVSRTKSLSSVIHPPSVVSTNSSSSHIRQDIKTYIHTHTHHQKRPLPSSIRVRRTMSSEHRRAERRFSFDSISSNDTTDTLLGLRHRTDSVDSIDSLDISGHNDDNNIFRFSPSHLHTRRRGQRRQRHHSLRSSCHSVDSIDSDDSVHQRMKDMGSTSIRSVRNMIIRRRKKGLRYIVRNRHRLSSFVIVIAMVFAGSFGFAFLCIRINKTPEELETPSTTSQWKSRSVSSLSSMSPKQLQQMSVLQHLQLHHQKQQQQLQQLQQQQLGQQGRFQNQNDVRQPITIAQEKPEQRSFLRRHPSEKQKHKRPSEEDDTFKTTSYDDLELVDPPDAFEIRRSPKGPRSIPADAQVSGKVSGTSTKRNEVGDRPVNRSSERERGDHHGQESPIYSTKDKPTIPIPHIVDRLRHHDRYDHDLLVRSNKKSSPVEDKEDLKYQNSVKSLRGTRRSKKSLQMQREDTESDPRYAQTQHNSYKQTFIEFQSKLIKHGTQLATSLLLNSNNFIPNEQHLRDSKSLRGNRLESRIVDSRDILHDEAATKVALMEEVGQHTFQQYSNNAPQCTPVAAEDISFTLVTQLSLNRLWMMEHHCERWITSSTSNRDGDIHNDNMSPHPISIAVYVGNNGTTTTTESIYEQLKNMGCPSGWVTVQILSGYSEEEYPVNALRNLALSAVRTSHAVYVDVDFWESSDLYERLMEQREFLSANPKSALVLPAFQLRRQCREWRECPEKNIPLMPYSKDDLIDLVVERKGSPFDPTNAGGHGSTRYKDWLEQPTGTLLPITCVKSNRYEPYLVFRYCHDLPPFQEAFTGYGKNKMTWMMQLRYSGYELYQLATGFVVHYPHLDSRARSKWNGGEDGHQIKKPKHGENFDASLYKRGQIDSTFVQFRKWLDETILPQHQAKLLPCDHDFTNDDEKLWVE